MKNIVMKLNIKKEQNYFFLDPLEGEVNYPEEPVFSEYIAKLPYDVELRFAPGRTEFEPKEPLITGCCYDFKIRFFPESVELNPGSFIKFSIPRTWTQPQKDNKQAPGYVTVKRSSGYPVKFWFTHNENLQWWICTEMINGKEPAGGFLEIQYSNVVIQRFPQEKFINWRNTMRTIVQLKGEGDYAVVPADRTSKPVIIAAPAAKFNIATPAVIGSHDDITVKFCMLDYCNNRSWPYVDTDMFAASMESPFVPLASVHMSTADKGSGIIKVSAPDNRKNFRILLADRKDCLMGVSPNINYFLHYSCCCIKHQLLQF